MRIGVLTGGGDCPGLNAVIRAVVCKAEKVYGDTVVGFLDGWRGVVDNDFVPLDTSGCRGLLARGGTVLGTSRHTPYNLPQGIERARATLETLQIEALVVIGGEGTLSCASRMHDEGFAVVGVPKTIDNDVYGTERTFGFDTAVWIATSAMDRLHTTAESHDRVILVEVMGRNVGHIATWAGIAGGAAYTLVPEVPFDIEDLCEALRRRKAKGKYDSLVVVAEGAKPREGTIQLDEPPVDVYGHRRLGGISNIIAAEVEQRTGLETRVTILGHVQRGGTPTPSDRVLATRFGAAAIDAVHRQAFGQMVALHADRITTLSLREATSQLRYVNEDMLSVADTFFA